MFGWLIRAGVIPDSICVECGDLFKRYTAADDRANSDN
jgi:hypothetical protein